jgi:glycosidase
MKNTFIGLLILITGTIFSQNFQIDRIEPPYWWSGMANPELQIMFYGENIADFKCSVTNEGEFDSKIVTTENPNYLFLYLNIPKNHIGNLEIEFSKDGKIVDIVEYIIKQRKAKSAQREGFNSSDVMYLITPDRFANGNTDNDIDKDLGDKLDRSEPFGRHGGDIKGIIDHLDYIEEMGFTAIWLNPILENAMPSSSYHGYATTDYYKIDPRYGSMEDYLQLSVEAQKRGIKLIMDQIMNHCGSHHWWMSDLPDEEWINSKEKYEITNHKRTLIMDPYAAPSDIEKFERGWFVDAMPDINGEHPLLSTYLIQNSIWWVEAADLGGIRHDTHPYPGAKFMSDYSCAIMNEYPNFNIVGEEWSEIPTIVAKWQRGNPTSTHLNSCMPSLMDFPLQVTLNKSLIDEETWGTGMNKLYEIIALDYIYPEPNNLVIFGDNHDMDRFYTQIKEDFDLFKMGIIYLATTRGIPQIYYGTEILMENTDHPHHHGVIRTDFPGGWETDSKNAFTGENLSDKEKEAQSFIKNLLSWRKNAKVVHYGKLMHYSPKDGMYVYFRYNNNEKVMVVLNKDVKDRKINSENYPEMLNEDKNAYNILTDKEFSLDKIIIPARSAAIFEIK